MWSRRGQRRLSLVMIRSGVRFHEGGINYLIPCPSPAGLHRAATNHHHRRVVVSSVYVRPRSSVFVSMFWPRLRTLTVFGELLSQPLKNRKVGGSALSLLVDLSACCCELLRYRLGALSIQRGKDMLTCKSFRAARGLRSGM